MDTKHLPVRPNININGGGSHNKNMFEGSSDPDVQRVINKKKSDALEIDSAPTKEEKLMTDKIIKQAPGYSWVVIGLAVVIIILIMIIIYYVLKYNEVSQHAVIIPASVVKPGGGVFKKPVGAIITEIESDAPEVTKNDLDDVLTRLATVPEEPEPEEQESKLLVITPVVTSPVFQSLFVEEQDEIFNEEIQQNMKEELNDAFLNTLDSDSDLDSEIEMVMNKNAAVELSDSK